MRFLLDTNAVSDILQALRSGRGNSEHEAYTRVYARLLRQKQLGATVCFCPPVQFEVKRGLIHAGATAKLDYLDTLQNNLELIPIIDSDWESAAQVWADLQRAGRTLSDMDILIAVVALRTDAILVSADVDFKAVPSLRHTDWRAPFL